MLQFVILNSAITPHSIIISCSLVNQDRTDTFSDTSIEMQMTSMGEF